MPALRAFRIKPRFYFLFAGLREARVGLCSGMSTISVSELKKKPAGQWLKSAGKDDLVVTSKGRPVAVLLRIAAASVESTRALVRSVRALASAGGATTSRHCQRRFRSFHAGH